VAATETTESLLLTMESSEYRDAIVASLCQEIGVSYKTLGTKGETSAAAEYGPCLLYKAGRAFDIVDFEEPTKSSNEDYY
jgi:hypothetical protein